MKKESGVKSDEQKIAKLQRSNAGIAKEREALRHRLVAAEAEMKAMRAAGRRVPMPYTVIRRISNRFVDGPMDLVDFVRAIEAYHEITEVFEAKESHDRNA